MRKFQMMVAAGAILLGAAGFAGAQKTPAALVTGATPLTTAKAGQAFTVDYELEAKAYLLFIPATGTARFNATVKENFYDIRSKVKVTGIADWFVNYDMNLVASGYNEGNRLRGYSYTSQNNDGKKNRRVEMKIKSPTDFDMTATPRFGNLGDPAATPAQAWDANDPITALMTFGLEPRAPGADPCGGPLKIFDGRQLTHLHLKHAGSAKVRTKAWKGEAIECHVTMDKVAGYKPGEADNDNLTGINGPLRMWLAPLPNGGAMPVKIQADTDKIGKVTLSAKRLNIKPVVVDEARVQ